MAYTFFDKQYSNVASPYGRRKKTLDDLEKDEKFLEVSERFLASVGEKSDDVFEYLRDSDFNLFSGMNRAMQSGKFTEQQKKDYNYIRREFDNADLGSLKQFIGLVGDASLDIATDPTLIVAALAAPFTGGTSLAARQGVSQAALQGAKAVATGSLKEQGTQAVKKAAAVTGLEVGAWTGLDNHFRQTTELNTGLRKLYSKPELAGSIGLGALTGGLLGGGIQKANLFYSKMNRLYSDDDYLKVAEGSFADKVYKTLEIGDKIKSKTIGAATSILDTKAKFSPVARELGNAFREDFSKRLGTVTRQKVELGHAEKLDNLRGEYHALFDEATAPIRKTGTIKESDELAIIRMLRGDDPNKYDESLQQVTNDLRGLFNRVFDDAIDSGLINPDRKLENYFPRSWDRKAIQENRPVFEKLLVDEKIVKNLDEANEVVAEMLNKNNELFSSHSILLTQARAFKNLKDNNFEQFLTNDLNAAINYYMNAANTIQHKRSFLLPGMSKKSNRNQFIERWITPMDKELRQSRGGRGLNRKERKDIINLYESVTGQVNYFDSGLIQGIYDGTKLANAMAYLPLATVSSLTEAIIPLTKTGGSVTAPVKDALKGLKEGHKIFVQDIPVLLKQKYKMSDSQIQKEMNQVFLAMDEAFAETTNRLTGEGLQNEFLKKVGRGFFRFNMLIPWTKSVQLASFNVGKNLIKENLEVLNKFAKEGIDVISETAPQGLNRSQVRNIQKVKSELFGLGIDIQDGLRWLNGGAKTGFAPARKDGILTGEIEYADDFYKSVVQGAGRFVNEVILPVGRDRARLPTFMTNPKLDIFTQFLRYPTVFSNTVLKNYINSTIVNPKVNGAKLGAFALSATSLALATNYWRSNEENRDRIATEGFAQEDVVKAFQRVGLLGPLEYGLRYGDSIEYTKNPYVSITGLGGPVMSDLTNLYLGRYGLTETVARKAPLIGTRGLMDKYFGANIYDPLTTSAREIDKEAGYLLGIKDRPKPRKYAPTYEQSYTRRYATGGLVEGPDVPFTKENPADRVDPFTGEPYQEQMSRLGFNKGGITDAEVLEMVADKPWFQRATQPGGKFLDDEYGRHTLLTTSSGADNKEYLYPRIREVDGELVDFKDKAFQEAIDRKDYIVFEGPNRQQEATEVSKKISELIMPMRQLNKQQTEGRLGFVHGGLHEDDLLNFILATEDINLYKDYKEGNLDKVIQAHEGSKRFQEQHGRKDVSTIGGVTGSEIKQATVKDTVDLVRNRISQEREYLNKILPEETKKQIPQKVKDAAVSLMFNVGKDAFINSNAYKNLSKGNIEGFYKEAFDPEQGFTKVTGADNIKRIDQGLVNRRQQELQYAQGLWEDPYATIY